MEFNWENMVRCAVTNVKTQRFGGRPSWYALASLFGLGSCRAADLCVYLGINPNEEFPESDLQKVVNLCCAEIDNEEQDDKETLSKMWNHLTEAVAD